MYPTTVTRGYSFAVFRVIGGVDEPGVCPPGLESRPSFGDVNDAIRRNLEYLVGTFPLAEEKVSYTIMPQTDIVFNLSNTSRSRFLTLLYRLAGSDFDWAVGVTCGCCGGTVSWDTRAVLIGNSTSNIHNLAHEASHITSVASAHDCYGCGSNEADCRTCRSSEGFWVNAWEAYPREEPPPSWSSADGDWAENEWLRRCYYMDFSNYAPYCWVRMDPVRRDSGGSFPDGYLNLVTRLADARDPEGMLVSGEICRDGRVSLDPFIRTANARPDLPYGTEGGYRFLLLDASGRELGTAGFDPVFEETATEPESGSRPLT
ncbi:MAG: hypothetical protein QHG99_00100 [Methanomicrobiales archaeon]|nr:hypothetical protein [Methanomicrobiales archaeon]